MYQISIFTVIQKSSLLAQQTHFLYIVFLWKMTLHRDALFLMCRTQAHFIQITLFRVLKSAALLSLILTIDSWKASVMISRSEISKSHHYSSISRSLWVQQDYQWSVSNHFFSHCLSNFLFNNWDVLESLNSKSDELLIKIWWCLHHYEWFSINDISSIMIITSDWCLLSKLMILLVAIIVVKLQVVTSLTFIMILTQSSVDFIILRLSLSIAAHSRLII